MSKQTSLKSHPLFNSPLVSMLVARIQKEGKRSVAERLILKTMQSIEHRTNKPALVVLETAVRRLMPEVSLVSQRVGASVYQIPRSIVTTVSIPLVIKWLISAAKAKKFKTISEALASEIIDAYNGQGSAVTKLQQNRRMAAANLVYAHLGKRQQNRPGRFSRKIFKSRSEGRERQSVSKMSIIRRQYDQVNSSASQNYDFRFGYGDQLWYPNTEK